MSSLNPLPLCRGRHLLESDVGIDIPFKSTPSMQRETSDGQKIEEGKYV